MPSNRREIRTRIRSVKNTQQITRAMQMVAAAKVRRARERVVASKPFADAVTEVFAQVVAQIPPGEYRSPFLVSRPVKKVALVIITSDRGLCGGYNSNVIRFAMSRHRHWTESGVAPQLVLVGTKAVQFFRPGLYAVAAKYQNFSAIPDFSEAAEIVKESCSLYASGEVDHVEFIYTNFKSMVSLVPVSLTLLPVVSVAVGDVASPSTVRSQYAFEPSAEAVMDAIIPKYLESVVYQALLEAAASELAARMTAMSAASKNAKELATALTLVYNKARQAAITQEILEVVGGAAAL